MDLLVLYLFVVSYEVSGNPLTVNNDLLNDVDSLEVQGYEVHEKLADRKDEGRPHFVTSTVHRHSSSSREGEGSSTSGVIGEQGSSVVDKGGVYEASSGAVSSGTNVSGKEVVTIINHKTNSHATPFNSAMSDSIKYFVGEDAAHTHKPIIERTLTLSEVDNGGRDNRASADELYTGGQHSPSVQQLNEESSSGNSHADSKDRNSVASGISSYSENVRQPNYPLYGSQVGKGSVVNNGPPSYYSTEDEESHRTGIYQTSSGSVSSGTNVSGKEIIKIVNHKTNSHATPSDSVLSDSVKHSVSDDTTYTHKPIIVRALTLSQKDNNRGLMKEQYTDVQLSPSELEVKKGSLTVNPPVALKGLNSFDSDTSRYKPIIRQPYKEIIRQPYSSSYGSQEGQGFVESRGSPYSKVEEKESVLHTTEPPKVLVNHNPLNIIQDETSVADVQRGIQGSFSRSGANQDEYTSKSFKTSMLPSGTQHYLDHSVTDDRINLFSSQPRFVLDQNIFGQYPPSTGEYFLNHNGFSQSFLPTQFDLERSSYGAHQQPTLHHVEHTLRLPSKEGNTPVHVRDEAVFGRVGSNHNLYFSSYPQNGDFAFDGVRFTRPSPSVLSYPREEPGLGLTDGFITDSVI